MIRSTLAALLVATSALIPVVAAAEVDDDQLGAWYMYFWNTRFDDSQWGLQGDVQHRNWDEGGDLEQLLLRGGITWSPKSNPMLFTFGYGNITSGEFGPSSRTSTEHRVYQEALIPHKFGTRIYMRHRLRLEQRWVENQDFRNRFRYALFIDVPLNSERVTKGTWYLAAYNEIFVNAEQGIGDNRTVETFDRDRLYGAMGYGLGKRLRVQAGYMYQFSSSVDKGQVQLSLHQSF